MRKFVCAICVSLIFIVLEIVGGWWSGSVAIMADAAHLASDILGFGVSILALKLGQKEASDDLTYGWNRAEILGTFFSIATIWVLTVFLLIEATQRMIVNENNVDGTTMLIIAVIALVFNLIQMQVLHSGPGGHGHHHDHDHDDEHGHGHGHHDHGHSHGHHHDHSHGHSKKTHAVNHDSHDHHDDHSHDHHDHDHHDHDHHGHHDHHDHHGHEEGETNLLTNAAFLHVLGDMMLSIGVIIASIVIYFDPDLWMADPLCTYLFSIILVGTTIPVIKQCLTILMEGTPPRFDLEALRQDIAKTCGDDMIDMHDLHVWTISQGKVSMSVHIVSLKPLKTLAAVTDLCRRKYQLFHTTIQVEGIDDKEQNPHAFNCENDVHK